MKFKIVDWTSPKLPINTDWPSHTENCYQKAAIMVTSNRSPSQILATSFSWICYRDGAGLLVWLEECTVKIIQILGNNHEYINSTATTSCMSLLASLTSPFSFPSPYNISMLWSCKNCIPNWKISNFDATMNDRHSIFQLLNASWGK